MFFADCKELYWHMRITISIVIMLYMALPCFAQDEVPPSGKAQTWSLDNPSVRGNALQITQEKMLRINATNLWKAMTLAPGVMQYMTGNRNEAGLSVRGYRNAQVQLMMDGVPVYVPYDGNEDYARYLVGDLDSIEISKGYSPIQAGHNALGGVIDMRSARPQKELEFKARYLNYFDGKAKDMGRHVAFSAGTKQERFFLKATGIFDEQDYYRISDDFSGSQTYALYTPPHRNQGSGRREFSASRDKKLNVQAGLTPTQNAEIVFGYILQRGMKEQPPYDGDARADDSDHALRNWDWPTIDKDTVSLRTRLSPHRDIIIKTNLYYDRYKNLQRSYRHDWERDVVDYKSENKDYSYGGIVELIYALAERHTISLSGSYRRDAHKRNNTQVANRVTAQATSWHSTREMKDDVWSAALEYTFKPVKALSLVLGGSYTKLKPVKAWDETDNLETTLLRGDGEEAWNGQAGVFWDVTDNHQLYATVAHKSRMPTMQERYRLGIHKTGAMTRMPNPDLKPEKALHYEVGWKGTIQKKIAVQTAFFYSEVRDLILDAPVRSPSPINLLSIIPQTQNRGKAPFVGMEVSLDFAATEWLTFGGSLSYIEWNLHDLDSSLDDLKITALPHVKANGYIIVSPVKGLRLIPWVEYLSESYFSSTSRETTDDFTLMHFKADYRFLDNFSFEAGIQNVFDTYYEYDEGYAMPGRTFYLGMSVDF